MTERRSMAGSEQFLTQGLPTVHVDDESKEQAVRAVLWQYDNDPTATREQCLQDLDELGLLETAQRMYAEARTREGL